MPTRIRFISRYGNGTAAVLFAILFVTAVIKGSWTIALFCGAIAALCAFNVHLTERAASLFGEEEWLKAEVRKAELRRRLVT